MELQYDIPMDKRLEPFSKIELFYWFFIGIVNPLFNWFSFFPGNLKMALLLFLANLIVLPVYILYARIIFPDFLLPRKLLAFIFLSVAFFIGIQAWVAGIYSILTELLLSPGARSYFSFSPRTIIRESLWTFINMFFVIAISYLKKTLGDENLLLKLQKDNALLELKYLRSQLNPHFLFNTLNSIYSLSLQKSDRAPEVVVKLADIMRYLIYECNEPKISLEKEINFIRDYIKIEEIRHRNIDIKFTTEGNINEVMIEPFLLMPFIENSFKHAVANSPSVPFIYISLQSENDQLELKVINDTNIEIERQAKRINGMGIRNTKNLLEILYPDAHTLNIIQTEKQPKQITVTNIKNARERLELLYPDAHTLDVILNNCAFTVSLKIKLHSV
jgi:two-component system, LytTR family, sensor kinase